MLIYYLQWEPSDETYPGSVVQNQPHGQNILTKNMWYINPTKPHSSIFQGIPQVNCLQDDKLLMYKRGWITGFWLMRVLYSFFIKSIAYVPLQVVL